MGDVITAEDLEKVYGEGHTATRELTAVSFGLQEGEFASLIGQSVSGKSTLLNLLGRPTSGRVLIEGEDTSELDRKELGPATGRIDRLRVPVPPSASRFTVRENMTMAARIGGSRIGEEVRERARDARPAGFAGGWRTRTPTSFRAVRSSGWRAGAEEPARWTGRGRR